MSNLRCNIHLQRPHPTRYRRSALSLTELIVVIGVLALMMTLAGEVMSLSVQSTGQAKALTTVNQRLRIFERTLRDDLRNVQRGESLILIQGNPVDAYWTAEGMDGDDGDPTNGVPQVSDPEREDSNGDPIRPRADMLMIFPVGLTSAAGDSDVTASVQQVVYGHARLGEYVPAPSDPDNEYGFVFGPEAFPQPDELPSNSLSPAVGLGADKVSRVPARQWHLARRSVLLMPTANTAWAAALTDEEIRQAQVDIVGGFSFEADVLTPNSLSSVGQFPWCLPPIFTNWAVPFARSELDPTPPPRIAERAAHFALPHCASFKVEWTLDPRSDLVGGRLDDEKQILWFDPGDMGDPTDPSSEPNPLRSLSDAIDEAERSGDFLRAERLESLLMTELGGHILPRYDNAGEFDEGNSIYERYRLWGRFVDGGSSNWHQHNYGDGRPNLVVFGERRTPLDPVTNLPGDLVDDDAFPIALRITLDVYDDEGRLERPIRHVMVIPIGQFTK